METSSPMQICLPVLTSSEDPLYQHGSLLVVVVVVVVVQVVEAAVML